MITTPSEAAGKTVIGPFPNESGTNGVEFRFLVQVTQDDEGIYSAIALNLPGTGSCGDTREKAIQNFKEAAVGTLEYYAESAEEIPWKLLSPSEISAEAKWDAADKRLDSDMREFPGLAKPRPGL